MNLTDRKRRLLKQRAALDQIAARLEDRDRQNWWMSGGEPPEYDPLFTKEETHDDDRN